jgi:hypothetical protein
VQLLLRVLYVSRFLLAVTASVEVMAMAFFNALMVGELSRELSKNLYCTQNARAGF